MEKKKVLIVDDSLTIRQQVRFALQKSGFDLLEAENGEEALNIMNKSSVQLVICDVFMPKLDGMKFLAIVKERGIKVPIIMLTTEQKVEQIHFAKEAGVKAWLVKPFVPHKLVNIVERFILE